ncbi:MAG: hypothetical protein SFV54_07105 [Bryobacteraceae bacterium]|nr:hypothetical protein [Bryobacteraceae bacterium]
MDSMNPALLVILLSLAAGFATPVLRAVYRFYQWRRSLERMDRLEWSRTMRALRAASGE